MIFPGAIISGQLARVYNELGRALPAGGVPGHSSQKSGHSRFTGQQTESMNGKEPVPDLCVI
eukprot:scaffold26143_cov60-Phaeocystis_antarctica.AAC.4